MMKIIKNLTTMVKLKYFDNEIIYFINFLFTTYWDFTDPLSDTIKKLDSLETINKEQTLITLVLI